MAKTTMDKSEVALFHKLLKGDEENDIPKKTVKSCVKILGVEEETLNKFTPKAFRDFETKQAEIEKGVKSAEAVKLTDAEARIAELEAALAAK